MDKKIPEATTQEAFPSPPKWVFETRCKVVHYATIVESLSSLTHSDYQAVFQHEGLIDGQSIICPWRRSAEHATARRYIRETLPHIHIEESEKYCLSEKIYMPPGMIDPKRMPTELSLIHI